MSLTADTTLLPPHGTYAERADAALTNATTLRALEQELHDYCHTIHFTHPEYDACARTAAKYGEIADILFELYERLSAYAEDEAAQDGAG